MSVLRHLLIAALAALSIMAAPTAVATAQPRIAVDVQDAFTFACRVMEYDCTGVPVPQVKFAPLYVSYRIIGAYYGDDAVWLDNTILRFMDSVYVQSILAHEITHYLDRQNGMEFGAGNACTTEWNAWRVGNAYLVVHRRSDLADYSWAERYGCYRLLP